MRASGVLGERDVGSALQCMSATDEVYYFTSRIGISL